MIEAILAKLDMESCGELLKHTPIKDIQDYFHDDDPHKIPGLNPPCNFMITPLVECGLPGQHGWSNEKEKFVGSICCFHSKSCHDKNPEILKMAITMGYQKR